MQQFEDWVLRLESKVKDKPSYGEVSAMINDTLTGFDNAEGAHNSKSSSIEQVQVGMAEIGERTSRENKLVIYGVKEKESTVLQERNDHDKEAVVSANITRLGILHV
jgi:hypothetical protein